MAAIRSTYSLDPETADAIRVLARRWGLSQAGVLRRAIKEAREREQARLSPQDAIARFKAGQVQMSPELLRKMAASLRAEREQADDARGTD